jgi:hypothetical protein
MFGAVPSYPPRYDLSPFGDIHFQELHFLVGDDDGVIFAELARLSLVEPSPPWSFHDLLSVIETTAPLGAPVDVDPQVAV